MTSYLKQNEEIYVSNRNCKQYKCFYYLDLKKIFTPVKIRRYMMGLRSSKVKIVDNVPKGNNYLQCANTIMRCFGKIILSKNEDFDFLFVEVIIKRMFVSGLRTMLPVTRPLKILMIVVLTVVHSRGKMVQKIKVIISTCSKEPLTSCGLDFIERRTYHEACCVENIQGNFYVIPCEIQEMLALLFEGGDFVFNCVCKALVGNDMFQN